MYCHIIKLNLYMSLCNCNYINDQIEIIESLQEQHNNSLYMQPSNLCLNFFLVISMSVSIIFLVCIYTSMYVYMMVSHVYRLHVYIYCIHICAYTYICIHICAHEGMYTCVHICIHVCIDMHVCIRTCVCVYTHTHTFTPIQGCSIGRITTVFYAQELCSHKLMDLSKIMQLLSGRSKI